MIGCQLKLPTTAAETRLRTRLGIFKSTGSHVSVVSMCSTCVQCILHAQAWIQYRLYVLPTATNLLSTCRPAVVEDEPSTSKSIAGPSTRGGNANAPKLKIVADLDVAYAIIQHTTENEPIPENVPKFLSRLSMAMAETQVRRPRAGDRRPLHGTVGVPWDTGTLGMLRLKECWDLTRCWD